MSLDWMSTLACPTTRERLVARETETGEQVLVAPSSGHTYHRANGSFDLVPKPLPPPLADRQALWDHLQYNGNVSYEMAPELNLQGNADQFAAFLNLSGRVLDIGCGPQRDCPGYARDACGKGYVGVDPLPGLQERTFPFLQAIGEALPFADGTYDHVVICGSIDHMMDWRCALEEATRVVAPGGAIHLKLDRHPIEEGRRGPLARFGYLAVRGARQVRTGMRTMGVMRTLRYTWRIMNLKIPPGALDYFHVYLPKEEEVTRRMTELGWGAARRGETDTDVFLTYQAKPAVA